MIKALSIGVAEAGIDGDGLAVHVFGGPPLDVLKELAAAARGAAFFGDDDMIDFELFAGSEAGMDSPEANVFSWSSM